MDKKPRWYELVERMKNFHGDHQSFMDGVSEEESFFAKLYELSECEDFNLDNLRRYSQSDILKMIFSKVFDFVVANDARYQIFGKDSKFYEDVFEACFFTALGTFIHETKRIKGMSLRDFVYDNSFNRYNDKASDDYVPPGSFSDRLLSEEDTLRHARHKRLSERAVYDKKSEWSAMRMASEHEWSFYYALNEVEDNIRDTFKRIGNLYNGVFKAADSVKDEGFNNRLEAAYKRFLTKLKKIKYPEFLELQKVILKNICKDTQYYGMNIYRLEKELRLYNITNEVKLLLECKNEREENEILEKTIIMNDLHFPKIYWAFSDFEDVSHTLICTQIFYLFKTNILVSSRLIIDKFVEKGILGEDWGTLFINTINEMTEKVFYDPGEIDYSVTSKSQKMFIKILSVPVRVKMEQLINPTFCGPISSLNFSSLF